MSNQHCSLILQLLLGYEPIMLFVKQVIVLTYIYNPQHVIFYYIFILLQVEKNFKRNFQNSTIRSLRPLWSVNPTMKNGICNDFTAKGWKDCVFGKNYLKTSVYVSQRLFRASNPRERQLSIRALWSPNIIENGQWVPRN